MGITQRIFTAIAALLLLAVSAFFGQSAFHKVLEFRTLERIPLLPVMHSTGGEVQLRGQVQAVANPLLSPDTKTPVVYYRYKVEEEYTDGDGDKKWRTIQNSRDVQDFYLRDNSGSALVHARQGMSRIDWSVIRKMREKRGDRRYTEWRIDVGDTISLFGWLDRNQGQPGVSFTHSGDYLPIISSFDAAKERGDKGWIAVLLLGAAITALSFMSCFVIFSLRIHRVLVFLCVVTVACSFMLLHYGWQSLENDVNAGFNRVQVQTSRSAELIEQILEQHNIDWDQSQPFNSHDSEYAVLSELQKQQINGWRLAAFQVRERYLQQISKFPENFYATVKGLKSPSSIPLPPDQLQQARNDANNYQPTQIAQQILLTLAGLVVTVAAAWIGFRTIRVKRIQENLPTSKTSGVVYGLTEVSGELVAEDPQKLLEGPLSGEQCTWFHYIVKERRGTGKRRRWVTIENVVKKQPFYCRDDEGQLRVFPSKAEIITQHKTRRRRGKRLYTETRLVPGDQLYLLGSAATDKTRGDSLVLRHEKNMPYIISNCPEKDVMLSKAYKGMLLLSATISAMFFTQLLIAASSDPFTSLDYILAALAAPLLLAVFMFILMFNDLVFLRQRCHRGWANIQVSLKKRKDVVPRLETIVKSALSHERELQAQLAKLRGLRDKGDSVSNVEHLMAVEHDLIGRLQVTIEQYPDLKTNTNMLDLHRRLVKLENEIALMRAGFNDAVAYYNTRIAQFPDNVLAKIFSFTKLDLLAFDKKAHQVSFAK